MIQNWEIVKGKKNTLFEITGCRAVRRGGRAAEFQLFFDGPWGVKQQFMAFSVKEDMQCFLYLAFVCPGCLWRPVTGWNYESWQMYSNVFCSQGKYSRRVQWDLFSTSTSKRNQMMLSKKTVGNSKTGIPTSELHSVTVVLTVTLLTVAVLTVAVYNSVSSASNQLQWSH